MRHYETLGVPATATQREIRTAYLNLALMLHPDKTRGRSDADELAERFRAVGLAYYELHRDV